VGYACIGIGVLLGYMAINSMFGFTPEGLEQGAAAIHADSPGGGI
jgi:hypothetical protein